MYKIKYNKKIYYLEDLVIKKISFFYYLSFDKKLVKLTDKLLNSLDHYNNIINYKTIIINYELYLLKKFKPILIRKLNKKHIKQMIKNHIEIKEILDVGFQKNESNRKPIAYR